MEQLIKTMHALLTMSILEVSITGCANAQNTPVNNWGVFGPDQRQVHTLYCLDRS